MVKTLGEYFIKNKIVHKNPPDCHVEYLEEKIYGTSPAGYQKCKKCFNIDLGKPAPFSK